MNVPFLDLRAHHQPIRDEVMQAISEVVDSNAFAGGPFVAKFEDEFAEFCGTKHTVGVGSGTDALWLALLAMGIGAGDEVITVPVTFIATAEAITYCGARPVFVDIDETSYNMDPAQLESAISPRTKAIIPVHLFGQMADMDPILEIANRHGIPVLEDSAQTVDATDKGRKAGSVGAAGCFSFYPGKNLGAFGEAGAVVTNNSDLAQKIRIYRDHGQEKKYYHSVVGWNGRMDGIQAAVLSVKLKRISDATEGRRSAATRYNNLLGKNESIILPQESSGKKHVYHVYSIRVTNRDKVLSALSERGIGCGIHYPIPLHLQKAYELLGYKEGSFPISERCSSEFLSLPMFPELTSAQTSAVAESLSQVLKGSKSDESVVNPA